MLELQLLFGRFATQNIPKYYCFQFINDFKRSSKRNSTDSVEKFKFAHFFLRKSARFEALIVNMHIVPRRSLI